MPDVISFLTAILGLFSAIVAYKSVINEKIKKTGEVKTVDDFKDLKTTANAFGTIFLVLIFYFGFIIIMMSFPSIIGKVLSMNNGKETEKKSDKIVDYLQIKTLNEISFYSANSIPNSTKKDEQFDIVLNNSLDDKEYDLVIKILNSYSSVKKKENSINKSIDYFIEKNEYLYALKASDLYDSISIKEKQKIRIISDINIKRKKANSIIKKDSLTKVST
jgi:hypothetical protein